MNNNQTGRIFVGFCYLSANPSSLWNSIMSRRLFYISSFSRTMLLSDCSSSRSGLTYSTRRFDGLFCTPGGRCWLCSLNALLFGDGFSSGAGFLYTSAATAGL